MAIPKHSKYVIVVGAGIHKMLGVGKLVAEDICGETSSLLEPFRSRVMPKVSYIQFQIVRFLGVKRGVKSKANCKVKNQIRTGPI